MKIFIVSQPSNGRPIEELIRLLSSITIEPSLSTSVVAIDELHNLPAIANRCSNDTSGQTLSEQFTLDDFCSDRQYLAQGQFTIDSNQLATQLSRVRADWVAIDLEHNLPSTTSDFIKKLARYTFMRGHLANRNLVLLVPSIYVGFYARTANEEFNNLPICPLEVERSRQVQMLFLSTAVERAALRLPLLGSLIRWLRVLFIHTYKRLGRPA